MTSNSYETVAKSRTALNRERIVRPPPRAAASS